MVDSIIFDLDGTLRDATPAMCKSWNLALKEIGYEEEIPIERVESAMGLPVDGIAATIFPNLPEEERLNLIRICFKAEEEYLAEHGSILYDGLVPMLEELKKKYRLYIVSNCQDGYIQIFLKVNDYAKYFDGFICAGDSGMSKGQNNLKLIREQGLKKPIYVGDTRGDMNSAIEAQIPFVYCRFGFGDLKEDEYEYGVDSLSELPALIATI